MNKKYMEIRENELKDDCEVFDSNYVSLKAENDAKTKEVEYVTKPTVANTYRHARTAVRLYSAQNRCRLEKSCLSGWCLFEIHGFSLFDSLLFSPSVYVPCFKNAFFCWGCKLCQVGGDVTPSCYNCKSEFKNPAHMWTCAFHLYLL